MKEHLWAVCTCVRLVAVDTGSLAVDAVTSPRGTCSRISRGATSESKQVATVMGQKRLKVRQSGPQCLFHQLQECSTQHPHGRGLGLCLPIPCCLGRGPLEMYPLWMADILSPACQERRISWRECAHNIHQSVAFQAKDHHKVPACLLYHKVHFALTKVPFRDLRA